jgi:hypothetical protein
MSEELKTEPDYKAVAFELQRRLVWALKFMRSEGSGMVAFVQTDKQNKVVNYNSSQHWTQWFADGVEMLPGYQIDRELLGCSKAEIKKILKTRAKNPRPSVKSADKTSV